ncbi:cytochrome b5 domain-containing protein [Desulfuromonas acetexigens]|uniref:Cytochrome B5 n=1 Tax=Trichloromonas acetexigens TaxID=38815 RepID=A0A550JJA4_9BACT|nr:cytochrome b5 domain-containing protein [Desulfuromonas acetexigens]TRO83282.1 cytochrome B5 [Desulfuromonas acetexigens]
MTKEELAKFDGRDGRKAYVAVNEKVYDVSESPLWQAGNHQGMHQAGADLTEELKSAPHVRAVVERFPVVGHLEEPEPPKKKKWGIF